MRLFLEHTPIEEHRIGQYAIFVKREDMYAAPPAPPLGKLRGARAILSRLVRENRRVVGCFESSRSRIGHGLAALCREIHDMRCFVAYPVIKNRPIQSSAIEAEKLGATLLGIPSNIVSICHRQAAKTLETHGGWMLPFGVECVEAIEAVALEAATIPAEAIEGGTLIVPTGSGVTLAGILRGLVTQPRRIISVSVGRSPAAIAACLKRNGIAVPNLEIRRHSHQYRDRSSIACPFPCDPYYDLKAWEIAVSELPSLDAPVLFWNVGG